jgi:hypothetical protein
MATHKRGKYMTSDAQKSSPPKFIQHWIVTLSILFFSILGVLIALLYLFAFSDVRPLDGSYYYVGSSIIMAVFLIFRMRNVENNGSAFKASISGKIIRWLVGLFAIFYIFWGLILALFCLFNETNVMYFNAGAVYFCGGAAVLAVFVFSIWKN